MACWGVALFKHDNDVIMSLTASEITSLMIVYSTVYSDADQRKHQSPASLAFVRGIHRGPVNSPHKGPVPRKTFPFDDVIMRSLDYQVVRRLTSKSAEVLKSRDMGLDLSDRCHIWYASLQQMHRDPCKISERQDYFNTWSRHSSFRERCDGRYIHSKVCKISYRRDMDIFSTLLTFCPCITMTS